LYVQHRLPIWIKVAYKAYHYRMYSITPLNKEKKAQRPHIPSYTASLLYASPTLQLPSAATLTEPYIDNEGIFQGWLLYNIRLVLYLQYSNRDRYSIILR
jgi:hypothetical protein